MENSFRQGEHIPDTRKIRKGDRVSIGAIKHKYDVVTEPNGEEIIERLYPRHPYIVRENVPVQQAFGTFIDVDLPADPTPGLPHRLVQREMLHALQYPTVGMDTLEWPEIGRDVGQESLDNGRTRYHTETDQILFPVLERTREEYMHDHMRNIGANEVATALFLDSHAVRRAREDGVDSVQADSNLKHSVHNLALRSVRTPAHRLAIARDTHRYNMENGVDATASYRDLQQAVFGL